MPADASRAGGRYRQPVKSNKTIPSARSHILLGLQPTILPPFAQVRPLFADHKCLDQR